MRNKQLVINFVTNFIAFASNLCLTFFLTPYVVGKVGSEAYGFVSLALNMVNYVGILTSALNSMTGRFISIEINSNNNEQANIYFNSVLRGNTIFALFLIFPSILLTVFVDRLFNVPVELLYDVKLTFGFVYIYIIMSLLGSVFSVATFVKNRLEIYSYTNIVSSIVKLGATLMLFMFFAPKIYYITFSAVPAAFIMILLSIHYTRKLLPEVKISFKIYSNAAIKTLLKSGLWNSLNQLSSVLLNFLDLMVVNILIGSVIGGQYSLSKTIPSFILTLLVSIVSVFIPQFTILYAQKKSDELIYNINLSIKIVSIVVIIPISFLLIYGDVFFTLWLPGEDSNFLFLLSNLSLIPLIIHSVNQPVFNVFTITNKLKTPAIVLLICGLLNTITIIALLKITSIGIIVIPLTSMVISFMRNLFFTPIYAANCLGIKWKSFYPSIFKGIVSAVIMLIISLLYKSLFTINTWLGFVVSAVICGSAALIINIFIIFHKNERKEAFQILKLKRKK